MSVVLWPIIPAWGATIAGTIFALATSASFLRDWFLVIGWLDPSLERYKTRQHQVYRFFSFYLAACTPCNFCSLYHDFDKPNRPLDTTDKLGRIIQQLAFASTRNRSIFSRSNWSRSNGHDHVRRNGAHHGNCYLVTFGL